MNALFKRRAWWLALMLIATTAQAQSGGAASAQQRFEAGDTAGALQEVSALLRTQPRDAGLRFLLGLIYMQTKDDELALAQFRGLTEDFPDLPDPYNNRAVIHAARGELELARQALEQAVRLQPAHAHARENLGEVYLRLAVQTWQTMAVQQRDARLTNRLRLARELVAAPPSLGP